MLSERWHISHELFYLLMVEVSSHLLLVAITFLNVKLSQFQIERLQLLPELEFLAQYTQQWCLLTFSEEFWYMRKRMCFPFPCSMKWMINENWVEPRRVSHESKFAHFPRKHKLEDIKSNNEEFTVASTCWAMAGKCQRSIEVQRGNQHRHRVHIECDLIWVICSMTELTTCPAVNYWWGLFIDDYNIWKQFDYCHDCLSNKFAADLK